MPVGWIRASRSKQCPFWVNFGYVVPEVKYAPKLVELIRYNGYGMVMTYVSWNQAKCLSVKIIGIDRQHSAAASAYWTGAHSVGGWPASAATTNSAYCNSCSTASIADASPDAATSHTIAGFCTSDCWLVYTDSRCDEKSIRFEA